MKKVETEWQNGVSWKVVEFRELFLYVTYFNVHNINFFTKIRKDYNFRTEHLIWENLGGFLIFSQENDKLEKLFI